MYVYIYIEHKDAFLRLSFTSNNCLLCILIVHTPVRSAKSSN